MRIVAATQNEHKLRELRQICGEFGLEVIPQSEVGLGDVQVEEDGDTFESNSEKKAAEIMRLSGMAAIADDSGLMAEALDGAPGVYSARFSGDGATDEQNNQKLLSLIKDKQNKRAKFVSVITLVYPDGSKISARGECEGHLIEKARGEYGFGYDPLFVPDCSQKTFAELTDDEKNKISHRAKALERLRQLLSERKVF